MLMQERQPMYKHRPFWHVLDTVGIVLWLVVGMFAIGLFGLVLFYRLLTAC